MAESLCEELKKAIRLARKRYEAELSAKTQALNDGAAVAVEERTNPARGDNPIEGSDTSEEGERR